MWTFFAVLAAVYVALFTFKIRWHEVAEKLYEKFGLDIGLFQIKVTFSAKGRWLSNIATIRRCKTFYKYGNVISLLLVVPSLILLAVNLIKVISLLGPPTGVVQSKKSPAATEELIFQPVIPGITFPLSDASIYGISLFVSTVFHELGHALAADSQDVKLLGYGILIIFIIPAAFVDLSTSELSSLSLYDQLKVYTVI